MNMADLLEDIVKKANIVPENPIIKEGKSFGQAELYSHAAGILATMGADALTDNQYYITVAAPILDKFVFLAKCEIDAVRKYKTTAEDERGPLRDYLKHGLKETAILCGKDLIQDAVYAGIMLTLFNRYPETPAAFFSAVGLVGGVVAVSAGQAGVNELGYRGNLWSLKRAGLREESCLEARFYIPSKQDALDAFMHLNEAHGKGEIKTAAFTDHVVGHRIAFNDRTIKSRIRYSMNPEIEGEEYSADATFSRSIRHNSHSDQQFNYFFQEKTKMVARLPEMAQGLDDIADERVRKALRHSAKPDGSHCLSYLREYFFNSEKPEFRVSLDYVVPSLEMGLEEAKTSDASHCVLELECPNNNHYAPILENTMRDVMSRASAFETTYDKEELIKKFVHR
jgi:hypothetical protein